MIPVNISGNFFQLHSGLSTMISEYHASEEGITTPDFGCVFFKFQSHDFLYRPFDFKNCYCKIFFGFFFCLEQNFHPSNIGNVLFDHCPFAFDPIIKHIN